ncbi:AcvB/VirJ family lysyl-phosphatidylglycerol hydrolase [Sinorhizobium sp. RAC02]|uniref:virulence factor family protein n=1 Tax=Sinorhizobium sp. RAC02 TaxID=1842534 RepID=UPI00083DC57A|nr:AcvB/VirJ family lysyl-phosphatidylglycerol hydrolase [Sinorhizobium sp. RAC02]AOF94263.1 alpha/beta hydrolase family protein [Sinorhizobium sp. RAC02]
MKVFCPLALAILFSCVAPRFTVAQENSKTFATGMIPADHILLPDGAPGASVFLISDAEGWGSEEDRQAANLVAKGAAVIGIDFPSYLRALRADVGDCVYMISDVESLAHQVQRAGGAASYNPPIVAGIGEGGALALAMIAQSPAATLGEAIAVDPVAGIPLDKVLCTPASKTKADGRTMYGFSDGPLPAPVTVFFTDKAQQAGRDHVAALKQAHADIDVRDETASALDTLAQSVADRVDAAGDTDGSLGLPLAILKAAPAFDTMAVVYSGDGGWRDIDKQVAGALQQRGIPVIGVDSLRYFWSERKPQETADDLSRIIGAFRKEWNVKHVLLVGYSFGADILPATYNLLSPEDRSRVPQLTLMALSHQVDYEISVSGWLGVAGEGAGGDPIDDIARIDPKRVQCISGTEEDDDPCPTLKSSGVEAIAINGGHHFDGDYEGLADRIVNGLKARLEAN